MATKNPNSKARALPKKTYVVVLGPVKHDGESLVEQDTVELTDQQAAGLRGFVELVKTEEAAPPTE